MDGDARLKHAAAPPGAGKAGLAAPCVIATAGAPGYTLLDSGRGRKLERFGEIVVDRPEPQALWRPRLASPDWAKAHAIFSASGEDEEKGKWRLDKSVPESWWVDIGGATVLCRLKGLWHLGLFPEQLPHWEWMGARVAEVRGETPRVLNLFGYTGAATLYAAAAGAEVTHVDASKPIIQWAKDNQGASGLEEAPVRWMLDDASKFAAREMRRGRSYHVIVVDPPKFGRGPSGEVWDLFRDLPALLETCAGLLAPGRTALVLSVYAIRASAIAFEQLLRDVLGRRGGTFVAGELALGPREGAGPLVPTSLFVRWISE